MRPASSDSVIERYPLLADILSSGLDAASVDRSLLQRVRLSNVLSLVIFALSIPFAVLNLFLRDPRNDVILTAALVLSLANLCWMRWKRDPVTSAHVAIFIGFSVLIASNVFGRDISDPSFGWLYLLALAAVLTLGPRVGWIWIGILLASTLVFWLLSEAAVPPGATEAEHSLRALLHRLSAILATGLLTSIGVSFQRRTEKSLEAEVAFRKRAEQDARDADRVKGELLANVSHEIRTPMNGVIGMTDLLLKAHLPPAQRRQVEAIDTSAEALLALVNDLLDFSKMEAGKLSLYVLNFRLRDLIEKTVALLAPRAAEQGTRIEIEVDDDLPDQLFGDSQRLRQVLLNLLGNAIRFTPQGSVKIEAERRHDTEDEIWVRFTVTDTGVGITPEDQAELFAPFSQAGSAPAATFGGTGLGLAISKNLVGLMGGEIGLSSTPGEGSIFWFQLPLWEARKSGSEAAETARLGTDTVGLAASHRGECRILVVDDDDINRLVALNQLKELGYATETVSSGELALEAVSSRTYDAILMDCQMPDLDGYETTRRIRQLEAEKDLGPPQPIIAVTAHAMKGERARCLEAGMNDYVSKPLRSADLSSMLDRWLTGRRRRSTETAPAVEPEPKPATRSALDPGPLDAVRRLGERTGKDLVGQMSTIYRQEGPRRIESLRRALRRQDSRDLARTAHALAGSAVYLGASALADLCRELEDLAELESWPSCATSLEAVETEHQRVLELLGAL